MILAKIKAFMKRKNIEISFKRYGIDALGAMAQGLFCSLLIGTIIGTIGNLTGVEFLSQIGGYTKDVSGVAMAVAIGYALKADPMVLFSLATVGYAANTLGGAGGPLAVLVIAIIAAEFGKAVSKETKIDILVTPAVTILVGVGLSALIAKPIGDAANAFGELIKYATELQPFLMGVTVSGAGRYRADAADLLGGDLCRAGTDRACGRRRGCGLLCPDGRLCGDLLQREPLGRTGQSGTGHLDAPDAEYHEESARLDRADPRLGDHRPDRDLCVPPADERRGGQLRHGYLRSVRPDRRDHRLVHAAVEGVKAIAPTAMDWVGLALICIVLPAVLSWLINLPLRKLGWVKDGDLKLA